MSGVKVLILVATILPHDVLGIRINFNNPRTTKILSSGPVVKHHYVAIGQKVRIVLPQKRASHRPLYQLGIVVYDRYSINISK